jgi:hypothetical protein
VKTGLRRAVELSWATCAEAEETSSFLLDAASTSVILATPLNMLNKAMVSLVRLWELGLIFIT